MNFRCNSSQFLLRGTRTSTRIRAFGGRLKGSAPSSQITTKIVCTNNIQYRVAEKAYLYGCCDLGGKGREGGGVLLLFSLLCVKLHENRPCLCPLLVCEGYRWVG